MTNSTENQSDFKLGDEVRIIKTHKVKKISEAKDIYLEGLGYVYPQFYELVPPKPVYPNDPLPHWELRIEHAKGADIEVQRAEFKWDITKNPAWLGSCEYRVKPAKTKDELRIEYLESARAIYLNRIRTLDSQLAELKPTVHY